MRYTHTFLWVSGLSLLLSACGGGGGGSTSSSSTVVSTPSTSTPSTTTLQTTSSSTYAEGSPERTVFSLVNAARGQCNFGLLNQSATLDLASKNHAKYVVFNGIDLVHNEAQDKPFFTGLTSSEQIKNAGYSSPADVLSSELVTILNASTTIDAQTVAKQSVLDLLSAPYHLSGMMFGAREIGIAQVRSADVNAAPTGRLAVNLFLASQKGTGLQQGPDDQISTYPCAGTTGTNTGLFNENPNPIPNINGTTKLSAGQPVLIHAPIGQVLTVSTATLTDANNQAVTSALLTTSNPQHNPTGINVPASQLPKVAANEAILLPLTPLAAQTTYTVQVTGTRKKDGAAAVAFNLNFKFTTGVSNNPAS